MAWSGRRRGTRLHPRIGSLRRAHCHHDLVGGIEEAQAFEHRDLEQVFAGRTSPVDDLQTAPGREPYSLVEDV